MNKAALRSLAPGLLASIALVAAGGALLFSAWQRLENARQESLHARQASHAIQQRLQLVQRDEPEIRHTLGRYARMRHSGLVGPEQRLDWADTMRRIGKQRRLDTLSFELAPQRKLGSLDATGAFGLSGSVMRVSSSLLHEGDLLRLLADLQAAVPGQTLPTRCVLERIPADKAGTGSGATVTGQCDIEWFSIQAPARSGEGASP